MSNSSSLDSQYSFETGYRILMKVTHGIETSPGTLIFRGYAKYALVFLRGGPRESLEEYRRVHRFRDALYRRRHCIAGELMRIDCTRLRRWTVPDKGDCSYSGDTKAVLRGDGIDCA
jgi:hypothetical protein